jgi:hypothetical protein
MIAKDLMKLMHKEIYEQKRECFEALGESGQYSKPQQHYALELISEYGVRATARILHLPRRTLQRWCRKKGVYVRRCPSWVRPWAERRRKRREFWQYRGY